ncbi:MAG TPA: cytochrome c oxidase assembly factor Coa1 family protein [Chthoniobacterales bacterium]|nr:cytochrome c oxidase assembly factor Coa1 family protein [Chthoniobacterales bacterium]
METAPAPPMPPTNWFGRNWKWVVPVGCLVPMLFLGGCALAIFFFAMGVLKQTDGYDTALARAQENRAVIEAIGSPISQTGIVSGNSNVNGATGELNLSLPLRGPEGRATLYVEAKKSADIWYFQTMVVKIEKTGERIDLTVAFTSKTPLAFALALWGAQAASL